MMLRLTFPSLTGSLIVLAGCSSAPFPGASWGLGAASYDARSTIAVPPRQEPTSRSTVAAASHAEPIGDAARAHSRPPALSALPTVGAVAATPSTDNTAGAPGPDSLRDWQTSSRRVKAMTVAVPIQRADRPVNQTVTQPVDQAISLPTSADIAPLSSSPEIAESTGGQPVPPGAVILTLDDVLQMAEAQNPQIRLARERINEAYARALRANALWLPSLRAGLNYNHHEGTIQDVAGTVFPTNRSAFYGGMGANAVGANSPGVPGVMAQFHFADAWFQPEIAEHQAGARRFGATATRNDTVRDASIAYLELARAEHAARIAQEAVVNTRRLLELTRNFAEIGQGLNSDYTRMQAELAIRLNDELAQQEAASVAAARLAQLLHANAGVTVVSGEPTIAPLDILNAEADAATYVTEGLMRRPELAEQKHLVCEAVQRMRRERFAPLVPSVLLGMSYGAMGGGLGSSIVNTGGRWDADAIAFWEVRNLGFGEQAARRETESQIRQAELRKVAMLDQVAREVVEAHARVGARRARIALAQDGIAAAEKSYQLNRERIENAQGLPIEVLQSIQALNVSRRTYLDAVTDYNIAQFQLCHATGALVR